MAATAQVWAPVYAARPAPHPVLPGKWIDVSNWQGALGVDWFHQWGAQGYQGLIVQCVTGNDGKSYTRQQLDAARQHGWHSAGYIWVYPGQCNNMDSFHARLSLFDGFALDFLAIDVEDVAIDVRDMSAALQACDNYLGRPADVAIYTRKQIFEGCGWADWKLWSSRKLWDAHYDEDPHIDANFEPYGGWFYRWMKQWTQSPLDQNTLRT